MSIRTPTLTKKDEGLTQHALDKLFASLDSNRDIAAERYEHIRQAIITFFEIRGSATATEDTDVTINRVARRLSEGQEIFTSKPVNYFYAVARNIWRERAARPVTIIPLSDELPPQKTLTSDPHLIMEREEERREFERKLACLDRCLQSLSPHNRELIVNYYQGDGSAKVENRKKLAESLGVQPNALRIKACRLRDKLETAMNQCMDAQSYSRMTPLS